jgi:uncharacterized protein YdiU (UPF0061 family)
MLVGFVHGVMNTDNKLISGESIDFGPCAFLDGFDPMSVYSSIDTGGRYAYARQPAVAQWNLARLAEAMLPLLADDQETAVALATEALGTFGGRYQATWAQGMRNKLGLPEGLDDEVAIALVDDLLDQLEQSRADYTGFFRALRSAVSGDTEPARGLLLDIAAFDAWADHWLALQPDGDLMDRTNPIYIPRNHLVEEALAAATDGDLHPLDRLLGAVTAPYRPQPGMERYADPAPDDFGPYRTFCGT